MLRDMKPNSYRTDNGCAAENVKLEKMLLTEAKMRDKCLHVDANVILSFLLADSFAVDFVYYN